MSIIQINNPLGLLLAFGALFISFAASAKDYKVEVLLFENVNGSLATESNDYAAPKRMTTGSETWRLAPTMLLEEAETLSSSESYALMHHYSWGIESLPYKDSANYSIAEREAQGFIKVYADQLLFANIDLDYKGFRMREKRRLKLNEKHFFDHPKFGILMQVSRLEKAPATNDSDIPKLERDMPKLESSR